MTSMCCRVATTQRQLDDALRVRWAVFGAELKLLGGPVPPAPREVNCFDTLETTVHLVVYADDVPVATSRLLLPNPEVARTTDGGLGIELDQKLNLSGLAEPGLLFAESTRFCILKRWRHSEALLRLQAGLYEESRRRGVTHWIASANTETDSAEDAQLVFQVAAHKGLVSQRWRVQARVPSTPPVSPNAPFYSPPERACAHQGRLQGLRLPRVLSLFAHKMGARFIAEPIYDMGFRRFSLPLVAALDELPPDTLSRFDALDAHTSHAA
ncbi:GNAT family N-acyltransferase [Vitiosangium sp. GDMCC 1.1324]|uniref:GNAT family N-acyltransferase n=1 Tax=Vitiosangium sp. (strain GDMCC 1.1324) TaxID=2138576 RepID=UPI000D3BD100|nr:GNAT family N-acyltransferase [Vitiosangium sp. GDMCC 1.1324]PTL82216.1 GNAT family N-acetyltransferase [Vitiosangium sp. GDMCC 1.1324]